MTNFIPISKIALEELLANEISPITKVVVEQEIKEANDQDQSLPLPRCSGREIRLPIHYRETQVAIFDGSNDDPLSYKMAMDDVDKEKCQEAMKLKRVYVLKFNLGTYRSTKRF